MELDESRLRAAPNDRRIQFDAGISYTALAIAVDTVENDQKQAIDLIERSVALRRRVADADPKDVQARERLVYGLSLLGQYQRRRGEIASARGVLSEAIRIQDEVFRATGDMSGRRQLAVAWFHVGSLEDDAKHPDAACRAFRTAQRLLTAAAGHRSTIEEEYLAQAAAKVGRCP